MSATLAVCLKELEPSLNIEMFETLGGPALESSNAWNNAHRPRLPRAFRRSRPAALSAAVHRGDTLGAGLPGRSAGGHGCFDQHGCFD
jgi:hypothetical protein